MKKAFLIFLLSIAPTLHAADIGSTKTGGSDVPVAPPNFGSGVSVGPKMPDNFTPPDGYYYAHCGMNFGCNFLKKGAEQTFQNEARAIVQQNDRLFEKKLDSETAKIDSDLNALRQHNGTLSSPEGQAAMAKVDQAKQLREKAAQIRQGVLQFVKTAETKVEDFLKITFGLALSDTTQKEVQDNQIRLEGLMKSRTERLANRSESSFDEFTNLSNQYSQDKNLNYGEMLERAKAYQDLGETEAANKLNAMADRWKAFESGEGLPTIQVSKEALDLNPELSGISLTNFQGYETTLLANTFASTQSPLSTYYGEGLVQNLLALQKDEFAHKFLGIAEYAWNLSLNLTFNPDFQWNVGKSAFIAVKDDLVGTWHLVRHPIDSTKALGTAIWNYKETYQVVKVAIIDAMRDLSTCDRASDECAKVLGKITGDVVFGIESGAAVSKGLSALRAVGELDAVAESLSQASINLANKANKLGIDPEKFNQILEQTSQIIGCKTSLCESKILTTSNATLEYASLGGQSANAISSRIEDFLNTISSQGWLDPDLSQDFTRWLKKPFDSHPERGAIGGSDKTLESIRSLRPERPILEGAKLFEDIPRSLRANVWDIMENLPQSLKGDVECQKFINTLRPHDLTANLKGWISLDLVPNNPSASPLRFLYKVESDGSIKWMIKDTH